jgi:SRSO17 transposase
LDRRLYLPKDWAEDSDRRAEAKVPPEVVFQTKSELAAEMLREAWESGVPMDWVTGDEVYGKSPAFRETIESNGKHYVLAMASTAPVWTERPELEEATPTKRGRPRKHRRLAVGAPPATTVAQVVSAWSSSSWERLTVSEGEKGPIAYDWGRQRVVDSRDHLPGPELWLLARRSISSPDEIAYYLCHAPEGCSLLDLARVASKRYTIEQCFEEGKGETGLDEYEVRYWHSWHRHITLSMMAHGFLSLLRLEADGDVKKTWMTSLQN